MIECPNCNSSDWECLFKSPLDPAQDKFSCKKCGKKWRRYDKKLTPKLDETAAFIVANKQYKEIIDAIMAHGGDLSSLVSAVNKHRYKITSNLSADVAESSKL